MGNEDRQLRQWLCVLYPDDNDDHKSALELLEKILDYDYCTIYHIPIIDLEDKLIKKGHNHCVIWFDKPMRKSTLIKRLDLNKETDWHLFKGLDEFKTKKGERMFSSVENYIDYCTHRSNPDKPDKYDFDDFVTNVPDRVMKALNNTIRSKPEYFMELFDFVTSTYKVNANTRLWGLIDWFEYATSPYPFL